MENRFRLREKDEIKEIVPRVIPRVPISWRNGVWYHWYVWVDFQAPERLVTYDVPVEGYLLSLSEFLRASSTVNEIEFEGLMLLDSGAFHASKKGPLISIQVFDFPTRSTLAIDCSRADLLELHDQLLSLWTRRLKAEFVDEASIVGCDLLATEPDCTQ